MALEIYAFKGDPEKTLQSPATCKLFELAATIPTTGGKADITIFLNPIETQADIACPADDGGDYLKIHITINGTTLIHKIPKHDPYTVVFHEAEHPSLAEKLFTEANLSVRDEASQTAPVIAGEILFYRTYP